MAQTKCIFCKNDLDGSDEHIIPKCINGRLHSKNVICSVCNSKVFGSQIDPIIKDIFNPILIVLGFDNAKSIVVNDQDERRYLYSKDLSAKLIRPEKVEVTKDKKTQITVFGEKENAVKMFQKEMERQRAAGKRIVSFDVKEVKNNPLFLCAEFKIEVSPQLTILLNKIALEFYNYKNFDYSYVKELCERVGALDQTLNNIFICNLKGDLRDFKEDEASHIIIIKSERETRKLYAYIELFNIICCVIPLNDKYDGPDVYAQYHQDAITGVVFNETITFKTLFGEIKKSTEENFEYLNNHLSERIRTREFYRILNEGVTEIKHELDALLAKGEISAETHSLECIKQSAELVAWLSIYHFPYMVEDFEKDETDEFNFIHSNFREEIVDKFCDLNKHLLGVKIKTESNLYTIDSFVKHPNIVRANKKLQTVYCKLIDSEKAETMYVKVRDLFLTLSKGELKKIDDSNTKKV